jgi:hypothetical protein
VTAPRTLFAEMVHDAAMFPPGNAPVADAVSEHVEYRSSWFEWMIGPLVVSDQRLAEVGRAAEGYAQGPLRVSVVNTGGAGGLLSLARRATPGLAVHAVETALRDLDDLAGNAARVVSAAAALPESVQVYVEIPYARGWQRAVEEVEAAGLFGKIRTGSPDEVETPPHEQLATQLSVLVEADLAFKATAGLHHAWRRDGTDPTRPRQHGFLNLLAALDALIEGAEQLDAVDLLARADREELLQRVTGWEDAAARRIRRRFVGFGCCGVLDPVNDLLALDLVEGPG